MVPEPEAPHQESDRPKKESWNQCPESEFRLEVSFATLCHKEDNVIADRSSHYAADDSTDNVLCGQPSVHKPSEGKPYSPICISKIDRMESVQSG